MNLLEGRKDEVQREMQGVNGFVSYVLLRTGEGGLSVTICQDKAGVEDSVKVAREWIQQNASATPVAPEIMEGEVIARF
jgi:hypothetical protein